MENLGQLTVHIGGALSQLIVTGECLVHSNHVLFLGYINVGIGYHSLMLMEAIASVETWGGAILMQP